MAEIRCSGTWGSSLTTGEFAAIRSVGFEPVGQVFGAAVYAAGAASGSCCAAAGGSFGPLVEAMYQARHTAIDRMTTECARLGGHGVVGVRLSRGSFPLGGLEFTAIGTAVRAPGVADGRRQPFTSDLSGQDFARLIMTGWVPVGLALGISIGSRHDARRRLESEVERLGAEGVVIAAMRLRVSQRACPVTVGRRDHIAEATLLGTAIASFAAAGPPHAGPALAVMPLGPQRRQPATGRI